MSATGTNAGEAAGNEEDHMLPSMPASEAEKLLREGVLQIRQGSFPEARDALLRAHVLNPASVVIRIYAAKALVGCRDSRAPQLIADWRDWLPLPDQQQYDLADVMQLTDWGAESVAVLEDLLRRSPGQGWAALLLAGMYERTNRLAEARTLMDRLLAENAATDDAALLGELQHRHARLLAREGRMAEARRVLDDAGPRTTQDAQHYFDLASLCDALGDESGAMAHLARAHALQRAELEHVAPQRLVPDSPLLPAASTFLDGTDTAKWPSFAAPDPRDSPVFVVGFPRSGTTLVERMLDSHPALQSMDERPHFETLADQLEDYGLQVPRDLGKLTQADCEELRKGYQLMACARIERDWNRQLVDKNPLNMLWLPLIMRIYPNARFVFVMRHPCDALISNYMQNYRSAVMSAISLSLERLAQAHVLAIRHWQHHVGIFKPRVLEIRYEELVADPGPQVQRLGRFLELQDADTMLEYAMRTLEAPFIGTPSYTQVIKPMYRHRVGRWLRYREYFGGAMRVIAPLLDELDYAAG